MTVTDLASSAPTVPPYLEERLIFGCSLRLLRGSLSTEGIGLLRVTRNKFPIVFRICQRKTIASPDFFDDDNFL